MPPGGELQTGRAAIQQFWQGVMGMGIKEVDLQTQEVEASGHLTYEIGAAVLNIEPAGGTAMTDTVKYVVVWKRHGSEGWQLAVDIWNANS